MDLDKLKDDFYVDILNKSPTLDTDSMIIGMYMYKIYNIYLIFDF